MIDQVAQRSGYCGDGVNSNSSENWCFTICTPYYCARELRHQFTKAVNTKCIEVILKRFPRREDYIVEGFVRFKEGVHKGVVETSIGSLGSIICIHPADKQRYHRKIQRKYYT